MDLSAIIFVVLALAWAVYLLPKALKHHDEMAGERLVEGHSDKVRILSRRSRTGPEVVEVEHVDTVERTTGTQHAPAGSRADGPAAVRPVVTRAAARKAARRRRRVLGVLVLGLVVVWALTWLAYLPIWAPAVPGAVVMAFLVVARLSVRRSSARRRAASAPPVVERAAHAEPRTMAEPVSAVEPVETEQSTVVDGLDLLAEDTIGVARQQIEAALADDGSLWDPLPVTLPTYVNKARARRTVRTIELTGINSSGHDESDTALAREAEQSSAQPAAGETDSRKVAGA